MKIFTLFILLTLTTTQIFGQKYVSVVESFVNTSNITSQLIIPNLATNSAIADTSDLNELYIQYHVPSFNNEWVDEYGNEYSEQQFNFYSSLNIANDIGTVLKNGATSNASDWFDCSPENKYIYELAKKVTVLYKSFDSQTGELEIEAALYTEYNLTSNVYVHVLALESNISAQVTDGDNTGQTFEMNNVVRASSIFPATDYSTLVALDLPDGVDPNNISIVAFVQNHNTGEILGGTRGIKLEPYLNATGETFAVVENFVNSGCYGGPPAINSLTTYGNIAENNNENHTLVQLHIGQTYGNWSDVYKLPLNEARYDKYAWDMGIIVGLAAVGKNGIRYKEHTWNNCSPLEKTATAYIDLNYNSLSDNQLIIDYSLSGNLGSHDRVYFYVIERGITVFVTGAEIPGTTLNMNNVARVARFKNATTQSDTVLLQIPADVDLMQTRVVAYIQNDVTYEITGGNKGFLLGNLTNTVDVENNHFLVYPNPLSSENVNIKSTKNWNNLEVTIHDLNGKLCYSKTFNDVVSIISIADHQLSSGIYLMNLITETENNTIKLTVY